MKWYYDTGILSIILLPDRDHSGKQGTDGQERRNSYSQATTNTWRDHQDVTVTTVKQQHGIHLHCWAPCGSRCWYSEVEDHKMLCPSEQTRVHIRWGICFWYWKTNMICGWNRKQAELDEENTPRMLQTRNSVVGAMRGWDNSTNSSKMCALTETSSTPRKWKRPPSKHLLRGGTRP
jgi:hypothetical protein